MFLWLWCYSAEERITEIDSEDLEKIEDVLEHMAESKRELGLEVVDLEALKEDITEYQEVMSTLDSHAHIQFDPCVGSD